MNPLVRDAQHLAYLVRRWFANRRMRREEVLDKATSWTDELRILDEAGAPLFPDERKRIGKRHQGRHARPGDIPNQPPAGRES